ncbi:MAG: vWA domain-containing protein [Ectothiorhodospiraceae bacterium]|jgi:uncharacterized protein (TIGR03503 family)
MHRLLITLLLLSLATVAGAAPADDARVLIDVSGSMKHNDPQNLRAPALRLFLNLLPEGSRSGIWLFATDTQSLAPAGPVDQPWRMNALRGTDRVHSRGQFTNIATALETASQGWSSDSSADDRRSLILLTDGMVDISKKDGVNEASRQRIIDELLPRLQAQQVKLYPIALSENADTGLLKRLARGTGGKLAVVNSADELERTFLHLFERSVDRETVPLEGNRFTVDGSVHELTVVAFKNAGKKPTALAPPKGARMSADTHPDKVRWHGENNYDLITVEDPAPGDWRLIGPEDPDNRVMIVTDLRLETSSLPNNMVLGEHLPFTVRMTEGDHIITRSAFLDLLDVRVNSTPGEGAGAARQWHLKDDGTGDDTTSGDGVFTLRLGGALEHAGDMELVTRVDGKTFQRQDRQRISISAAPLAISAAKTPQPGTLKLRAEQTAKWLQPETLRLTARLPEVQGGRPVQVSRDETGVWQLEAADLPPGKPVVVQMRLQAMTVSGRSVDAALPPRAFEVPAAANEPAENSGPTSADAKDEGSGVNWLLVSAVVVVVNTLVIGLGIVAWLLLRQRKRRTPSVQDDADDTGLDTGEAAQ